MENSSKLQPGKKYKNRLQFYIFLLLILSGCNTFNDGCSYKEHVIKKGEHTSNNRSVNLVNTDKGIKGFFIIDSYEQEHDQINKIVGFSSGFNHHENSLRIGFMFKKGSIDLFTYSYSNGERNYEYIKTVKTNQVVEYDIFTTDGHLNLYIDNYLIETNLKFNKKNGLVLYPYIGGKETFNKDFSIFLKICE